MVIDANLTRGSAVLVAGLVLAALCRQYVVAYHPAHYPMTAFVSLLMFAFLGIAVLGAFWYGVQAASTYLG